MRSKILILVLVVLVVAAGVFLVANRADDGGQNPPTSADSTSANEDVTTAPQAMRFAFGTPKKSAHYETNTPAHGAILAAPPINVVIDFNFDLAPPSRISISNDGKEYGIGDLVIDRNKLSMRRNLDPSAPDGLYTVKYNACWPDRSCHEGYFEFAVDRSTVSAYVDMTNRPEVTISMSEILFKPQHILISAGTKVTWVNDEEVEHYVNTDSHPAHTYYPAQNSSALKQGARYSVTFTQPGAYPYHCSAHADAMTGNIVVQ